MKKLLMILALAVITGNLTYAQTTKLGYINSGDLLKAMPEVTKADSDIAKYARSFQEQLETMSKNYQSLVQQFQSSEKTMSDAVKEVKMKEIQDLQNRIESTQQSAQEKVAQKKQELLSPIIDKATNAIKAVAKEKNYDYVFDANVGSLLYYKESDNLLPLVKAKLGLK